MSGGTKNMFANFGLFNMFANFGLFIPRILCVFRISDVHFRSTPSAGERPCTPHAALVGDRGADPSTRVSEAAPSSGASVGPRPPGDPQGLPREHQGALGNGGRVLISKDSAFTFLVPSLSFWVPRGAVTEPKLAPK